MILAWQLQGLHRNSLHLNLERVRLLELAVFRVYRLGIMQLRALEMQLCDSIENLGDSQHMGLQLEMGKTQCSILAELSGGLGREWERLAVHLGGLLWVGKWLDFGVRWLVD